MATHFQAALLVASPSYPNAVAWSDENLVAVASGHLVTILNPALPSGPRGLITLAASKPFPIGVIERKDLLSGCLLPTCLSRDLRPCVRSISWSPIGLAPNAGCLLSVCTTEGRVKLYRMPYCEFSTEWVEVCDISEIMYNYLASVNFMESDSRAVVLFTEQESQLTLQKECIGKPTISVLNKERKRKRQNALAVIEKDSRNVEEEDLSIKFCEDPDNGKLVVASKEIALFSCSLLQEGSSVEVLRSEGQRIWIAGVLSRVDGTNALVVFPGTNKSGKREEWVKLDLLSYKISSGGVFNDDMGNQNTCVPIIRPSMNVGYLPQQISSLAIHRVGEIIKVGDIVEAWTNDRWIEGTFVGSNEKGLLVKLHGDMQSVTLDASSVRLAPLWIDQEKSWQITLVKISVKDQDLHKVDQIKPGIMKANNLNQHISKAKIRKKTPEESSLPLLAADQYASRIAMLSSLVVAWSPIVQSMSQIGPVSTNDLPNRSSILAIGGKGGKISFWRIDELQCFSVMSNMDPTSALLVGLLQAHSAWITAISWSLFAFDDSDPRLLLVTGSSDGSVKTWLGYTRELLKSSEISHTPFSLLQEVLPSNPVPISVVSHIVSKQSPHKMHVAVGKGSGSFDVLICEMATTERKFDKIGSYDAHDHIVTGLVWTFDGCCLYSCSQDNSVRSWTLCDNSLSEVPFPLNSLGVKSTNEVPNVSDSCSGLAISPGNLVVAVTRSFDAESLNPMYQARFLKAAVEFFWIGGQQIDISCNRELEFEVEACSGFPKEDLIYWSGNLMCSLNQFEDVDKPLVVWDVIEALLSFKRYARKYVENILAKWLISCVGNELDHPLTKTLSQASKLLLKMSSRQLHILNIMIRRVFLAELKSDQINLKQNNLKDLVGVEEHFLLWLELLLSSERELRARLVAFSFSAILSLISQLKKLGSEHSRLVGLAQMEQWVALNHDHVQDHLKVLVADIRKLKKSKLQSACEYVQKEQCSYCSASVPFESAEVAFCSGENGSGVAQSHKLVRCAASMQVLPLTASWLCVCCQRRVSNLPPSALFKLPAYPLGFQFSSETSRLGLLPKPLCPFCGILLQRLQPEFLLSTSPV